MEAVPAPKMEVAPAPKMEAAPAMWGRTRPSLPACGPSCRRCATNKGQTLCLGVAHGPLRSRVFPSAFPSHRLPPRLLPSVFSSLPHLHSNLPVTSTLFHHPNSSAHRRQHFLSIDAASSSPDPLIHNSSSSPAPIPSLRRCRHSTSSRTPIRLLAASISSSRPAAPPNCLALVAMSMWSAQNRGNPPLARFGELLEQLKSEFATQHERAETHDGQCAFPSTPALCSRGPVVEWPCVIYLRSET